MHLSEFRKLYKFQVFILLLCCAKDKFANKIDQLLKLFDFWGDDKLTTSEIKKCIRSIWQVLHMGFKKSIRSPSANDIEKIAFQITK